MFKSLLVNLDYDGSLILLFLSFRQYYPHQSLNSIIERLAWLPSQKQSCPKHSICLKWLGTLRMVSLNCFQMKNLSETPLFKYCHNQFVTKIFYGKLQSLPAAWFPRKINLILLFSTKVYLHQKPKINIAFCAILF